jgi:hypothetical protein
MESQNSTSETPIPGSSDALPQTTTPQLEKKPRRGLHFAPAFWTIASIFSLIVNIILIIVLISVANQLFALKQVVETQVLAGLYKNFIMMDQAHIRTTIPISMDVPAKFDLPLKTNTTVTLTEDTTISHATVARLQVGDGGGGLVITNAPASIVLPAGTRLPIALDLTVPVDQKIPVSLNVSVDIPLSQTDLHEPFVGLQEVVRPYYAMLNETPNSWKEIFCGGESSDLICTTIFP